MLTKQPDLGSAVKNPSVTAFAPVCLTVRCFAEKLPDGQWHAFTLELGLAAQGASFADARAKLDSMIKTYVVEAVTIDREYAAELLTRRATWQVYLKYYVYRLMHAASTRIFSEPMPLAPIHCPA